MMAVRRVTVMGAVSAAIVLGAGVLVASPALGQDQPGAAVLADPVPVTARVHTPAGAGIKVVHAKFTNHHRLVRATVVWNKKLLAKPGHNDRFNVRVVAVAKGKKAKPTMLATFSSTVVKRRTQVRFWLSASAARKVRSAKSVVLSVSQQYDSPRDRDNKYEDNYLSTVYLKGSMPAEVPGLRRCDQVDTEPRANLTDCDLSYADLSFADLFGANLSSANLTYANLTYANLNGANLSSANLYGARLCRGTDLHSAIL